MSFVDAFAKYNLVHQYTEEPQWIGVDISELRGQKNTNKRKMLGELHARGIWKVRKDTVFSRWFRSCDKWTEQKHDISDSYLIALRKWKEIQGTAPKVAKGPKTANPLTISKPTTAPKNRKSQKITKASSIKAKTKLKME